MKTNSENKKSILIISHSYKPFPNPRAFRWTTIAEQFIKQNYNVDIITSWQPGLAREEIINGVHVFRVGGSAIEKLRQKFISSSSNKTNDIVQTSNMKFSHIKNLVKSTIHYIHDNTWKKIYWPDYAALWKKPALESALYLIENHTYDQLITVSDPFTSHLVGMDIKKQHENLFWLVDIGDPFCFREGTQVNNSALYQDKNYKIERDIFSQANTISVTNKNTKQKYSDLFPESLDKIEVMPPLLSQTENNSKQKTIFNEDDKIRLVFIGTLYKLIRNPRFLLAMFDMLMHSELQNKIELHFFGGINDTQNEFTLFEKYMNKTLFLHGIVPRDDVIQAMNEASVLINIGNDNIYQLPSKLVEYIDTGNPIINIAYVDDDISEIFLQKYESLLSLINRNNCFDEAEYKRCFNFLNNLPSKLTEAQRIRHTAKFKPEIIAKQYLKEKMSKLSNMQYNNAATVMLGETS